MTQECQRDKSSFQKDILELVFQSVQDNFFTWTHQKISWTREVRESVIFNSPFVLLIASKERALLLLVCLTTFPTLVNQLQPPCLLQAIVFTI